MEIVSKLPTKPVIDLVFTFVNGEKFTLTLGAEDTVDISPDAIGVQHFDEDETLIETIIVQRRNLLYYSRTTREVTIYAAGQSPMELALAQMTNTTTGVLTKHHVTYTQNLDNPTNPRQGNY